MEDLPDYDELLERIQVIHTPQNAGLFDYSHMPEDNDKLEAEEAEKQAELEKQQKEDKKLEKEEIAEEFVEEEMEEKNDVVEDLLNALNEPDDGEDVGA